MLVTMAEILNKARAEGGYAVTAPNCHNEDTTRACIEAAEENNAPMILDIDYLEVKDIMQYCRMACEMCKEASVPIAINLDHGATFEHAIMSIRAGMTSIMTDRSTLPFEENIAQVAELTKVAHAVNVSVEAELGHVGQGVLYAKDRDAGLTDPSQAKEYVERTGIDFLAVAIGTAHGVYKGTPHLDFDLLHTIYNTVDVPLVLHGGSGTGDENLARAAREGISKVNLATDLYTAGYENLKNQIETVDVYSTFNVLKEGYKNKLIHYMKLFNQCGKA